MLKNYFEKYLMLNLRDYPSIAADLPINIVLLLATLALSAAFVALHLKRRSSRRLLGQLLRHEAVGESRAMTLAELGLAGNGGVHRELSSGGFIRALVGRVGGVSYTYEEYVELEKKKMAPKLSIDFDTERFYIPEDRRAEAERAYDRYNTSALHTVVFCLFFLVIFVCISLAMPSLLYWIDSLLGG